MLRKRIGLVGKVGETFHLEGPSRCLHKMNKRRDHDHNRVEVGLMSDHGEMTFHVRVQATESGPVAVKVTIWMDPASGKQVL